MNELKVLSSVMAAFAVIIIVAAVSLLATQNAGFFGTFVMGGIGLVMLAVSMITYRSKSTSKKYRRKGDRR